MQKVTDKKSDISALLKDLNKLKVEPYAINNELENINTSTIREKMPVINLLRRPQIGMRELKSLDPAVNELLSKYSSEVCEQVEIHIKYESYIDREQKLAEKIGSLDEFKIRPDFDYDKVKALSSEAREKLKRLKPETIGQASRISGVSPSDISVLTIYMGK
jgi:tRNA uridine 5-carboxymethylaminomethyl modification enzyme